MSRHVPHEVDSLLQAELAGTRRTMSTSLVFAMEVQDSKLWVMDHCARVSLVSEWIAHRVGIHEADRYILQLAARLHEVGMFAVPQELLHRRAPLSSTELQRVRAQAEISAQVARLVHPPRVAQLIERQYEDYRIMADRLRIPERDILLAGILRVADVFAAVTWPRPYQDPMPTDLRDELLQSGAGTRFHPMAVNHALKLEPAIWS